MDAPAALDYEIVDVFAPHAFAGNSLAVVFDADGLTTGQCQRLANEFNLSETSFLSAPREGGDYRLRIFTPNVELPFAGHPSVGAAHTLVRTGRLAAGTLHQECGAGVLDVVVDGAGARLSGGTPTLAEGPDPADLAEALGLSRADLVGHPADVAGCGLAFTYLHVHPDAVDRALPDPAALDAIGGHGVSVFSWDHATATARARVFADGLGWGEDPATGSAALGTGVWLAAAGLLAGEGTSDYVVRQGEWMGRPSVLTCTVTTTAGAALAATVAGPVVPVASGRIRVPS
ncbi:PhzF family phenazine biosynthesis protein [Blastococcus sp. TF02A-26]|uniref:PhzF family phenazine biosynthesis protein n=1 Tax=Blastococcus sp. TF02A-26 TaxID=2250577 RepID=UPI000DE8003B|nr:PhzF family phenazine biosynthesis protein [Blastococcus sp. TF02A-26]RBY85424.1 phenazine biosynthesis protein PhzF [Blastococcus sp. TF02A-26]